MRELNQKGGVLLVCPAIEKTSSLSVRELIEQTIALSVCNLIEQHVPSLSLRSSSGCWTCMTAYCAVCCMVIPHVEPSFDGD